VKAGGSGALADVLSRLSVPHDRIIYIHSSIDWLGRAGIGVGEALNVLVEWVDRGGTLVMPAYPFRGSHEAYLQSAPSFDVRQSPARVGLLNETLRRRKGVKRSLDPDLSIVAFGPQADAVIGSRLTGPDPTGADSPFQRIIELGGVLVGLGVSFNYMNMIHVLDSRYRDRYPFAIYSDKVYTARSVDETGSVYEVTKQAMLNELQVHIKPSHVVRMLNPARDTFRSERLGNTDFFIWDLISWERLCVAHIERTLDEGGCPCWLTEFQRHMVPAQTLAAGQRIERL
jgi:aminoglycoside N3'-acetyltransferase